MATRSAAERGAAGGRAVRPGRAGRDHQPDPGHRPADDQHPLQNRPILGAQHRPRLLLLRDHEDHEMLAAAESLPIHVHERPRADLGALASCIRRSAPATPSSTTRPTTATPTRATTACWCRSSTTRAATTSRRWSKRTWPTSATRSRPPLGHRARRLSRGRADLPRRAGPAGLRRRPRHHRDVPGSGSACPTSGTRTTSAMIGAARIGERELLALGRRARLGRAREPTPRRGSTTARR